MALRLACSVQLFLTKAESALRAVQVHVCEAGTVKQEHCLQLSTDKLRVMLWLLGAVDLFSQTSTLVLPFFAIA